MSQFGRRDDRHPGLSGRPASTAWRLEKDRNASPTRHHGDDHEALTGFDIHDVKNN